MPNVEAKIDFLARIPLYDVEKPYLALLSPEEDEKAGEGRRDNLEYETHEMEITDIRENLNDYTIEDCGFQVLSHTSANLALDTTAQLEAYKRECEKLLKDTFKAAHVFCYDLRLRKNVRIVRTVFDQNDPFLIEGPALGAHNDCTFDSGPKIIARYLPEEEQTQYFKPGYRFRVINMWRPLLPELEDRPLALCDFRHLDPHDLMAADRILPDRAGEVYYLQHNSAQRWCWLEKQRIDEPFIFKTYDMMNGKQSKYCPHVSFLNPRAAPDAPRRRSVETRNIVITTEEGLA